MSDRSVPPTATRASTPDSALRRLLAAAMGEAAADRSFAQLHVAPALCASQAGAGRVSRAELAQALNMLLFADLQRRVPLARDYLADCERAGRKVVFDHGAVRTVAGPSGALPPGEAAIARLLRPLGFVCADTYPLERLRMTGRAWRHEDFPSDVAQFFVSELHPERFTPTFQQVAGRVLASSRDPLGVNEISLLERLARDRALPWPDAAALLPRLAACFDRHHGLFSLEDYEALREESAEMAWIATEGTAFNHATDRVEQLDRVAAEQHALGRPIKETIEVSASGRVRQTAFRAVAVPRAFLRGDHVVVREVPGSFYEFIERAHVDGRMDLGFDAANATGIFRMTAAASAGSGTL